MAKESKKGSQTVAKTVSKPVPKADIVSLAKYARIAQPRIHKYTLAYIEVRYRGILKTVDDWAEELKQYEE